MKINNYFFATILALVFTAVSFAQTAEQFRSITKDYDRQKLQEMADDFSRIYRKQSSEAEAYAKRNNLPLKFTDENGITSQLMKIDKYGNPLYRKTMNVDAGKTIGVDKLYPGGELGLELTGDGMIGGIWDGGRALLAHELLEYKIFLKDESPDYGTHATHVAGTMIGRKLSGETSKNAKGMAYDAILHSYDWNDDLAEMTAAAADGLLVSNHSYGLNLGSVTNPASHIGVYSEVSSAVDNITYNAPYYTVVAAAGNDRGSGINSGDNGYNILGAQFTTAKNTIVVAAVEKVLNYTGPSSVIMSSFSSWGPTKDNRIKPDISADGVMVFSSVQGSPTSYGYASGTSMASPTVSGSIILLQQLSAELNNGEYLKSATIRALVVQTARETGETPGPDPRFGWGLLDVAGAAKLMLDHHDNSGSFYAEKTLSGSNPSYSKTITYNGDGPLKATIAWTDPADDPQPFTMPVLINDLDLRITDSQGNTFYPWRLADTFEAPALNDGDNSVDNIEQVFIADPVAGEEYTITVTHKDQLENGSQDFSIAVSGTEPLSVDNHELTGVTLYPNPASNQVSLQMDQAGEEINFVVYDMNGRQVMNEKLRSNSGAAHHLNISKLNNGVYFVNIETEGKRATKKLIVQ